LKPHVKRSEGERDGVVVVSNRGEACLFTCTMQTYGSSIYLSIDPIEEEWIRRPVGRKKKSRAVDKVLLPIAVPFGRRS